MIRRKTIKVRGRGGSRALAGWHSNPGNPHPEMILFRFFATVIRCEGEFSDVVGCHTALRSLCEIVVNCGSGNRPVICECVTDFGYPEPERVTDEEITFAEACQAAREARANSTQAPNGEEL